MTADREVLPGGDDVARRAAELFTEYASSAIRERGQFLAALSGGSTPKTMYGLLASPPLLGKIDWSRVQLFWGDERSVPPDHPDSNYRMTREALLSHIPIPPENIHRPAAESSDLDRAAREYEQDLRSVANAPQGTIPRFDMVLLGMGDDGHTASLFPGTAALQESERLFVPNRVEKLNTVRLTATRPLLNAAAVVLFLVAGGSKAARVKEVLQGPHDWTRLPSQSIQPQSGRLIWLLDSDAASQLT